MTIPKDIEESLLPKSLRGKSYADAAEYLQKESKERELDPISKIGLNTNLMRLAQLQEANKPEETSGNEFKEGGNMNNKYDNGGPILDRVFAKQKVIMNPNATIEDYDNTGMLQLGRLMTNIKKTPNNTISSNNSNSNSSSNNKVSKEDFSKALADKGFTPEQVEAFLHIAQGESGFNLGAYRDSSKNTAGGNDIGLLQFNDKA